MNNIKFQYYHNEIKSSEYQDYITLDNFIDMHTNDISNEKVFNDIFKYSLEKNEEKRKELKSKLMHFTPAVNVSKHRRLIDVICFTGIAVLDFDKLKSFDYANDFKIHLFQEFKEIICCYLSPSRLGVKALIKIPVCENIFEFKEYYHGISYIMQRYNGFDGSPQNAVLPLFQSYDSELLYRDFNDAKTWFRKGIKKSTLIEKKPMPLNFNPNNNDEKYIFNKIEKMFKNITDNGHPQVLSASTLLGGYVGAGYINLNEAISFANNCIENNSYLSKGLSGYKKTSNQCINHGISKPIYL